MAETKRKDTRTHLTLQQKAQLRAFLTVNPSLPQFAVAEWVREQFHVRLGRTTLYRIQHAPDDAFTTGNLSRKKQRRVKFPAFERRLLDLYEQRRAQKEDIPDDELLRQAAECRAACGINATELKLSNGWLYLVETPLTTPKNDGVLILSAQALTTVQAPGFFNWEAVGELQLDRVQTDCVFKVYSNDRVVGRGDVPTHVQNNVACSIWEGSDLLLDAQTLLKVEFLSPGYAFTDSSLVLKKTIQ
ncbi:Hypothetical protein PHPALM_9285 [Phytophthora palmivora]|uniref:HTH CENPB-type domain-containing protein n=1 Tax=Phytophthora palmivora TaxID=4796 RepID=A0A2P4Y7Q1_9STRA|nr:Hypothetical protein PHPALM_9285 [Phytophthora palmivora]